MQKVVKSQKWNSQNGEKNNTEDWSKILLTAKLRTQCSFLTGGGAIMVFGADTWSTPQVATVVGVDDLVDDDNQVSACVVYINSNDSNYNQYTVAWTPTLLNLDDDTGTLLCCAAGIHRKRLVPVVYAKFVHVLLGSFNMASFVFLWFPKILGKS